jgi:hypothetical protein
MTIHELIETLKNFPPGMQVVVKGYEGGYKWWDGAHAEAKEEAGMPAVLLSGENKNAKPD